jgi:hypothetical protein
MDSSTGSAFPSTPFSSTGSNGPETPEVYSTPGSPQCESLENLSPALNSLVDTVLQDAVVGEHAAEIPASEVTLVGRKAGAGVGTSIDVAAATPRSNGGFSDVAVVLGKSLKVKIQSYLAGASRHTVPSMRLASSHFQALDNADSETNDARNKPFAIVIPPAATRTTTGDEVNVVATRLSRSLSGCFPRGTPPGSNGNPTPTNTGPRYVPPTPTDPNDDVLVTDVVDIRVTANNTDLPVRDLPEGNLNLFTFPIPAAVLVTLFSNPCQDNGQGQSTQAVTSLECSWFDTHSMTWSAQGCTTSIVNGTTLCSCNHLTEFSVLRRRAQRTCDSDESPGKYAYMAFTAVYGIVLIMLATQFIRSAVYTRCKFSYPLMQQGLGAIVAIARILVCLVFGDITPRIQIIGEAVIVCLPYLVQFWIFTLLGGQWYSTLFLAMRHGADSFKKVVPFYVVFNIIIIAAVSSMALSIGSCFVCFFVFAYLL